jgi:TIGR00159 family protein
MDFPTFPNINITWRDILDIFLVTIIFYHVIGLVKKTRAVTAIYGLLVIILTYFAAQQVGLNTLGWLFESILNSLLLLVIIVFQSDIRQALTSLGSRKFRMPFSRNKEKGALHLSIVCEAAQYMAARKIGAIIVIECNMPLGDTMERGVELNARLSRELLINLFWPNSPMHDGAVILRKRTIVAGGCILPLSTAETKRDYGTRHRAALGITEETDAVAVVVSEERGVVAIAVNGQITDPLDGPKLLRVLTSAVEKRL